MSLLGIIFEKRLILEYFVYYFSPKDDCCKQPQQTIIYNYNIIDIFCNLVKMF